MEIATAAVLALAGAVVAFDSSLAHDVGWNANGPGPGYFPFRIGLLLAAVSLVIGVRAARAGAGGVFVTAPQFGRTLSVFWPTAALAGAMTVLGCYVPSALYLAWMMHAHGSYRWPRAIVTALSCVVVLFLVFDVWFRIPLAKGPVEAALGLY